MHLRSLGSRAEVALDLLEIFRTRFRSHDWTCAQSEDLGKLFPIGARHVKIRHDAMRRMIKRAVVGYGRDIQLQERRDMQGI
jgi:hypothetical protein